MSDDFESSVRDMLRERAAAAPRPEPVTERVLTAAPTAPSPALRTSTRPTWVTSAIAACAVLVLVLGTWGAVALIRNGSRHQSPAAPTAPAPSQLPTPSVPQPSTGLAASQAPSLSSSPNGGSPNPAGPAGGPVPAGFRVSDLTFVSPLDGWALGTAPCATKPCTSLARTTDGGRSWVGLRPPDVGLTGVDDCITPCVTHIRFASSLVGYLFGSRVLYLTTDGGATWQRETGGAVSLEIGNGTVLRVQDGGCLPGCGFQVQRAAVGSSAWRTVLTIPPAMDTGAGLARTGQEAFVQVYGHVAGGAPSAHSTLFASNDDGATWTNRGEPCPQTGAGEIDANVLATADDGSVSVLCAARTAAGASFVATSTDAAATFRTGKPLTGLTSVLGAASASDLVLATETSGATRLVRSTDGGQNWYYVTPPVVVPSSQAGPGFLGFENSTTGRWVPVTDASEVWTTTDGGATWTSYRFR